MKYEYYVLDDCLYREYEGRFEAWVAESSWWVVPYVVSAIIGNVKLTEEEAMSLLMLEELKK